MYIINRETYWLWFLGLKQWSTPISLSFPYPYVPYPRFLGQINICVFQDTAAQLLTVPGECMVGEKKTAPSCVDDAASPYKQWWVGRVACQLRPNLRINMSFSENGVSLFFGYNICFPFRKLPWIVCVLTISGHVHVWMCDSRREPRTTCNPHDLGGGGIS